MVQSHEIRHLNVHVVQSAVQNIRLQLIGKSEVVKTPWSGRQIIQIRFGSTKGSAQHRVGGDGRRWENGSKDVAY